MKKKFLLLFSALVTGSIILLSCLYNDDEKEKIVVSMTYNMIKAYHYDHIIFDDDMSQKIFDKFIDNLDYSKRFFLKSDIKKLSKYSKKIDDDIRKQDLSFFETAYQILQERQKESEEFYKEILAKPFDLTKDETIDVEVKDADFATSKSERYDYWRKLLKMEVLQEIVNEQNIIKNKLEKGDTSVVEKSLDELEKEAREKVLKNSDDYFSRLNKLNRADYFSLFINAITLSCDPHSDYFAPKSKEDFDIAMSGELEGIGATLTQRYGEIKVSSIVVGGAAWKQGELEEGDVILKVAQKGEEPVSIVNMRLDDAVRLIRGKKGTEVTLTIRKIDGTIKEITIVRDKIILEETYVRSVILTDTTTGKKVAFIYLPSFYIDFQHRNGRKCSDDFKKELLKLKDEKVDGVIVDLRNNGGGSLQEVVKIAGFFIPKGPIVQVKDRNGKIMHLDDKDASILYDGNVVVLVNQFSASASEIFAAALQDYNRAVIFGTPQSHGKGTVQQMFDLDQIPSISSSLKPLGALKLTIQKFYRINGGSTQIKGVQSDISYHSIYSYLDVGEESLDNALPWDKIPALDYDKWTPKYNLDTLRNRSKRRMQKDSAFIATEEYAKFLKQDKDDKIVSLNLDEYKKLIETRKAKRKELNKQTKKKINLKISFLSDDKKIMKNDTIYKYRYENWSKKLQKDFVLQEAYNIVEDMKQ